MTEIFLTVRGFIANALVFWTGLHRLHRWRLHARDTTGPFWRLYLWLLPYSADWWMRKDRREAGQQ